MSGMDGYTDRELIKGALLLFKCLQWIATAGGTGRAS